MMINRRHFLAASATAATLPMHSVRWARAETKVDRPIVIVFLRGGMDSLNFLAPADDKNYESARPPQLRVPTTGSEKGLLVGGVSGSGDLLLSPHAKELAQLWKSGRASLIPASGLHHATRSHFQAMDFIERGLSNEGVAGPRDGWLTRAALAIGKTEPGSIVCMGGALPQSLSLCESAMPIGDVWDIEWMPSVAFREALFQLHASDSPLDRTSRQAMTATGNLSTRLERNGKQEPQLREPPKGVAYPDHEFGRKLQFLAEMLRMAPDISIATADLDGWDTHDSQAYQFPELVRTLSQSLAAFDRHLEAVGRPATIVVQSEFGRRIKANESGGTDHGHGGLMMVLGPTVNGGNNFGRWPGLATEQLDEGMDLAVTTDFRDVLATMLDHHGSNSAIAAAFPGYKPSLLKGLFA
jgi:uncharacterized protein (DUF1501 family)